MSCGSPFSLGVYATQDLSKIRSRNYRQLYGTPVYLCRPRQSYCVCANRNGLGSNLYLCRLRLVKNRLDPNRVSSTETRPRKLLVLYQIQKEVLITFTGNFCSPVDACVSKKYKKIPSKSTPNGMWSKAVSCVSFMPANRGFPRLLSWRHFLHQHKSSWPFRIFPNAAGARSD